MPLHLRHHHHHQSSESGVSDTTIPPGNSSCSPSNTTVSTTESPTLSNPSSAFAKRRKRKYPPPTPLPFKTSPQFWVRVLFFLGSLTVFVQLGTWWISPHEPTTRKMLTHDEETSTRDEVPVPAALDNTKQQPIHNNLPPTTVTTPLAQDLDWSHYTVRMNTWKRSDQLQVSIRHFLTCDRVASVQVVWCTAQGPLPDWLETWRDDETRLTVELHAENSLNARFDVLEAPPTMGILSVDDDVLRPCLALDVAFAKWTSNPDRLVGFDARTHVVENSGKDGTTWKYGYLSTTTHTNRYSITLSRCAFVHVDHLRSYTHDIPAAYRAMVTEHMNCEDILLSFWVSHLTDCQPPLLADYWAMKSMIKLYSPQAISGTSQHKQIRDVCVDTFRRGFGLDCLEPAVWVHHDEQSNRPNLWETGAPGVPTRFVESQASIERVVEKWRRGGLSVMGEEVGELIQEAQALPYRHGLIEGSAPWKKKYQKESA